MGDTGMWLFTVRETRKNEAERKKIVQFVLAIKDGENPGKEKIIIIANNNDNYNDHNIIIIIMIIITIITIGM